MLLSDTESWSGLAALTKNQVCVASSSSLSTSETTTPFYCLTKTMAFAAARLLKDKQQKEQQLDIKKVFLSTTNFDGVDKVEP